MSVDHSFRLTIAVAWLTASATCLSMIAREARGLSAGIVDDSSRCSLGVKPGGPSSRAGSFPTSESKGMLINCEQGEGTNVAQIELYFLAL